ncbi:hypothetical protein [Actinophytocola sp.]|uniref:hypothetical protein n=1 Tax=Actinophytocola sp. TaxID=1872138 RepID=UPI002ED837F8
MRVLVSFSGIVRLVALGFALGIVVGVYFGLGGASDPGSADCGPDVVRCAPPAATPATPAAPPAEVVAPVNAAP